MQLTVEGTTFALVDPDASLLRDAHPRGGYEPSLCALLAQDLGAGTTFFDIGGLYGFYSVYAALRGGDVVVFEPSAEYAAVLALNLERNGCTHVRLEQIALAARDSSRRFASRTLVPETTTRHRCRLPNPRRPLFRSPRRGRAIRAAPGYWRAPLGAWLAASAGDALGLFNTGADSLSRDVPTSSLDRWVAESGVTPSVVKIDVHGGEVGVLAGMTRVLRDSVTAVAVEVHSNDLLVDGTHSDIVGMLEAADLEVFELRGFRRARGRLVPLVGDLRKQFCDEGRWSLAELRYMRCLYARRRLTAFNRAASARRPARPTGPGGWP